MSPAIRKLVLKNVRRGRNAVAATVDLALLALVCGAVLFLLLQSYFTLAAALAFACAGICALLGVHHALWEKRLSRAEKRVRESLFERCFAEDLLNMPHARLGQTISMILGASALRVREDNGVLMVKQAEHWLPAIFVRLPAEETITRRDVWRLMGRLQARGFTGALLICTCKIDANARAFAEKCSSFPIQWMEFKTLCTYAREAGFALDEARLETAAEAEIKSRPTPRRFHDLMQPRHIRRIALSGAMLWLISYLTAWSLYYRLTSALLLALAAFLLIRLRLDKREQA